MPQEEQHGHAVPLPLNGCAIQFKKPTRGPCLPVVAALRYASALNPDMAQANKLLDQILRGGADANIPFSGMVQLLKRLGFQERIKGSHHIFSRDGVAEILNLQPHSGKCKPYQVKQVRNVIINYRLAGEADD
jgi:predicted RNA binding protein YcfA (HicA-like mRNA interferase family)